MRSHAKFAWHHPKSCVSANFTTRPTVVVSDTSGPRIHERYCTVKGGTYVRYGVDFGCDNVSEFGVTGLLRFQVLSSPAK